MRHSRTATALAGLLVCLVVSVVAWYYFETFLLILFVPLVPLLLRGHRVGSGRSSTVRSCPACGFETLDDRFEFCPIDGNRLE